MGHVMECRKVDNSIHSLQFASTDINSGITGKEKTFICTNISLQVTCKYRFNLRNNAISGILLSQDAES